MTAPSPNSPITIVRQRQLGGQKVNTTMPEAAPRINVAKLHVTYSCHFIRRRRKFTPPSSNNPSGGVSPSNSARQLSALSVRATRILRRHSAAKPEEINPNPNRTAVPKYTTPNSQFERKPAPISVKTISKPPVLMNAVNLWKSRRASFASNMAFSRSRASKSSANRSFHIGSFSTSSLLVIDPLQSLVACKNNTRSSGVVALWAAP